MFGLKKHQQTNELLAPITGEIIDLSKVSDPVFAQKMMGEGFAITPDLTDKELISPISGQVSAVQGHAVGITREDGLEFLIHVGIDTVSLKGEPFTIQTKVGKKVKAGTPLVEVDWQQIIDHKLDPTVMILIPNSQTNLDQLTVVEKKVAKQDSIGQAISK